MTLSITSKVFRNLAGAASSRNILSANQIRTASTPFTLSVTTSTQSRAPDHPTDDSSVRFFAHQAASSTTTETSDRYAELVKETIKKMMSERREDVDEQKPISDQSLEGKFNHFKKVYDEAESCLNDLQEITPEAEDYLDECSCARGAVEHAFTAYVDLLEDLRRANESQLDAYLEVRNAHAHNLKGLRRKLDELLMVKPPFRNAA
ncbi:hypothetical protein IV203_024058 [Nitzschia inconspicua]|uniref:Uncharacterized protein n=1 Tax=Nitzschia inconspicua TaxID=303405 RepID=A0A9K3KC54_9STRA|nr:hypothetical protein IV203_024058 [Nitzschia inconspicua]